MRRLRIFPVEGYVRNFDVLTYDGKRFVVKLALYDPGFSDGVLLEKLSVKDAKKLYKAGESGSSGKSLFSSETIRQVIPKRFERRS
jgi:hypothetical protein